MADHGITIQVNDPNGGDTSLLFPGSRVITSVGISTTATETHFLYQTFDDNGALLPPSNQLFLQFIGANFAPSPVPGSIDTGGNVGSEDLIQSGTSLMSVDFFGQGPLPNGGVPVPSLASFTLDYLVHAFTNLGGSGAPSVEIDGNIGNDRLYGSDATDSIDGGNGNDLLYGNGGNDILVGGAGSDIMFGGFGDDQFFVDSFDAIVEAPGQGNDRVFASANYTLSNSAVVEIMSTNNHAGTTAINLTGNDLGNTIFGNAGDNILDGQGGVDELIGNGGNDTYFVDNAADRVDETAGQGNDRVFTSVSFNLTLGQEIERLQTTDNVGTQALNLRGNEFNNFVIGNNGDNIIAGSAGNDTLFGFGGNDRFLFETSLNASTNVDQIADFTVGSDLIMLVSQVFTGLGTNHFLADANFLVVGSRGQDGDDRVLYDPSNGALHFDADGNGAGAAVTFAFVQPGTNLHASDIFVV